MTSRKHTSRTDRNGQYITCKKLVYTINFLKSLKGLPVKKGMEYILNQLAHKDKNRLVNTLMDRARQIQLDTKGQYDDFLEGESTLENLLDFLCGNTRLKYCAYKEMIRLLEGRLEKLDRNRAKCNPLRRINDLAGKFVLTEVEKEVLNTIMDSAGVPVIWITNNCLYIDESTRRRFDYSLDFLPLSADQRKAVWKNSVRHFRLGHLLKPNDIKYLAGKYRINAGGIEVAARNLSQATTRPRAKVELFRRIDRIIRSHQKVMGRACREEENTEERTPVYILESLNVKGDLDQVLGVLKNFNSLLEAKKDPRKIRNVNLLMMGPPGTGKTEFARYVARKLQRPLLIERASSILSKYMGESEQNIHRMFMRAERERAILLIDEADSLFYTRERASQGWEVSQTNELLTNMEEFRGILICATNYRQLLDPASIRRFTLKLEFDYLAPKGNVILYRKLLAGLVQDSLTPDQVRKVGSIKYLTPGDFKAVYQKYALMEGSRLTQETLIRALEEEIKGKGHTLEKAVGF